MMYYSFPFLLSSLFCSCFLGTSEKTYKIETEKVKSIKISQMSEREITGEILIDNPKEIEIVITGINDNKQFLTKFLPTYKAEILFKNSDDTLHLMFREKNFKVHPGGTFKMTKSISELIENIGK